MNGKLPTGLTVQKRPSSSPSPVGRGGGGGRARGRGAAGAKVNASVVVGGESVPRGQTPSSCSASSAPPPPPAAMASPSASCAVDHGRHTTACNNDTTSSNNTIGTTSACRSTLKVPAWSRYRKLETIGAGAFGVAYLVAPIVVSNRNSNDNVNSSAAERFVIKRMFLQGTDDVLRAAATEVRVLQQVVAPHPNIIRYVDHFVDDEGYINIVMEYCPGGDLEQLIRRRCGGGGVAGDVVRDGAINTADNGGGGEGGAAICAEKPFTLEEVLFIAFQLLAALAHLHACGVVHRDLKPANIFICASDSNISQPREGAVVMMEEDSDGDGATFLSHRDRVMQMQDQSANNSITGMTLKLADFGIAKVLETTHAVAKTVIGTPFYISPQLCNDEPYSSGADVWALGCIIYEVASGCGAKCFGGENMLSIVRKICSGQIPHLPSNPSMDMLVRPLLLGMLCPLEAQRLTASQVLHQFFYTSDADFADDFEDPEDDL